MNCRDCTKFYLGGCQWAMDYMDTEYAEDCVDFDNMRDILKRNEALDVVDEEPSHYIVNLMAGYCPRCKELITSYKERLKPRIFCPFVFRVQNTRNNERRYSYEISKTI